MDIELIKKIAVPIGTFLADLYTPWIRWEIEKRRNKQHRREGMINGWYQVVGDESFNFDTFAKSSDYASLKTHIRSEIIKTLEAPRTLYPQGIRGNAKQCMLLDEISRLEKEWDLV